MAITRFKNSSIANKGPKYDNALAGLPYIPIIGTATDGGNGTSASVAFTGNNVAGAGITYTALSTPGSFTGTGTASPVTVTGLTAGTSYTFQVKAGNSLGDSAYSAASNSVTPVTPTSFESIASSSPSGVNSVTFSSIPSTYKHLQIKMSALTDSSGYGIYIRFNSDSSAKYTNHYLYGNGSTTGAGGYTTSSGNNHVFIFGVAVASDTTRPSVSIVDIADYSNTSKNKTVRAFAGIDKNGSGEVNLLSGAWLSTAAISSISILCDVNFSAGTTFALYGIKGS